MTQLVDQYGNPLKKDVLHEPQTARLGWIASEYAEHPSRGLTPQKLHNLFVSAEQGNLCGQADLFSDMEEKDAHLYAEISKRKRALLTLDWWIEPPAKASEQEKRDAEELEAWLRDRDDLEDVMLDALDGIGHGFGAQYIQWELNQKVWLPESITYHPQRNFMTPVNRQNELRLRDMTGTGEALWSFGWILHEHKAKSGYIARSGLYRVLALPWLFRNLSTRDLADFCAIYGIPMRIGKYPAGSGEAEQDTLLHAITMLGRRAGGIMPKEMDVEIKEAAKGTHEPFVALIDWAERSMSKAVLGGTLTSQSDGKSSTNALGNVHNEVRQDLKVSDARQLAATLSRDLVYPIRTLNQRNVDPRRRFRFVFDTRDIEDIGEMSKAIPPLVQVGVRIPEKWLRDKLAIPDADKDEAVLTPHTPAHAPSVSPAELAVQLKRKRMAVLAAAMPEADPASFSDQLQLDEAADNPPALLDAAFEKMLKPVIEQVQQGLSAEDALTELAELFPAMPDADLIELLTRVFFVADLWGRIATQGDA